MPADAGSFRIGELDTSKVGQLITINVARYTTGMLQVIPRYGASLGSWSCSVKRAIGPSTPQAFPTALAFTASVLVVPGTDAMDLSATETLVLTNDVAGTGLVDFYFTGKADL